MVFGKDYRSMHLVGLLLKDFSRFGRCLANDDRDAGLDDTSLLSGYLFESVTQETSMVKGDISDDGELRGDNVGAVETASKTDFYHGDVNMLLSEILERHRCGQFEERRTERLEELTFCLHEINDILLGNGEAVNADALREIHQMGRGIEPYPIAAELQEGCKCVGGAALAVSACDVDSAEMLMGVIEMGVEGKSVAQAFLIRTSSHLLKGRSCCIEIL